MRGEGRRGGDPRGGAHLRLGRLEQVREEALEVARAHQDEPMHEAETERDVEQVDRAVVERPLLGLGERRRVARELHQVDEQHERAGQLQHHRWEET